jgi:2-polyprenyl-3-methyl-5-hydroxy-6-metoxy-1,4-benzoquinol methylase/uncharacterized protein YbaR (Trm112 family)
MKYRLIDLLQCSCGRANLSVNGAVEKDVPFKDSLREVKCSNICALRKRSASDVSPTDCNECHTREVETGTITCVCGKTYPIVRGIPRFLPDSLTADLKSAQDTFSYEWKMFRFGERNWGQDIEHRKGLFLDAVGASPEKLRGKLILDAGCGSGLLSMEMAETFGMEVVALDLASGLESAYAKNTNPYVYFLQGSVLDLPFRQQTFEHVYCAGVLVHCPNVREGFKSIVPAVRKNCRCFIWVYHPISKQYHPTEYRKIAVYNWIRTKITARLPIQVQHYLYLSVLPVFFVKQFFDVARGKRRSPLTWREKMQDLIDFFSPLYQHRHEPGEVTSWFSEEGFTNVVVCNVGPHGFGVRGDRADLDTKNFPDFVNADVANASGRSSSVASSHASAAAPN